MNAESLESAAGLRLEVLDLGASIRTLRVPATTRPVDTVLAYPDPEAYKTDAYFLGATVGPFANRICSARFQLDHKLVTLDANESSTGHCLHGGSEGLHRQLFVLRKDEEGSRIECRAALRHGTGGFPGNREVLVVYQLLDDWTLAIDMRMSTDRTTVANLANHAYINLGGALDDHEIRLHADRYTPVDRTNIPTGELRNVDGTRFDLRELRALGQACFDHNFEVSGCGPDPRPAATLRSPQSGLQLDVLTTQPGLQLYTADHLATPFAPRAGLCLEAQNFPDAVNQPEFPSARLGAGETYQQRTVYRFSSLSG